MQEIGYYTTKLLLENYNIAKCNAKSNSSKNFTFVNLTYHTFLILDSVS